MDCSHFSHLVIQETMNEAYIKTVLTLFSTLTLLLLITSILLFGTKIGFSLEDISNYYRGNEELFIVKKSFEGLLETTLPHLFSITTLIFIVIHLLLFTEYKKFVPYLLYGLLLSSVADLSSGYLLVANFTLFAVIKWVSFLIFEILFFISIYLIILDIMRNKTLQISKDEF